VLNKHTTHLPNKGIGAGNSFRCSRSPDIVCPLSFGGTTLGQYF